MADKKKAYFSKSPSLKILLRKFHGLVLGLVDAKGIDVAQLSCEAVRHTHFLPVLELMSDSLTAK